MTGEDERFALRAALVLTLILSLLASFARVLNVSPFGIVFDVSLVYLPTIALFGGFFVARVRRARGSADSQAS